MNRRLARPRAWAPLLVTFKSGFQTWLFVIKLMAPALVLTRLLLYFDLIGPVAGVFAPVMGLMGLPSEAALVWVASILGNLYVAISVYLALTPVLTPALTLAQITTLGGLCLLAHALLIEGQICRGAGLSFWRSSVFRILAALVWGVLLHQVARLTGWGAEPAQIKEFMSTFSEPVPPWGVWLWLNLKQFFLILVVIEALMLLMDIFKYLELTRILMKILGPVMRLAGVGESALMVTVIGCVVGLTYGGSLIIAERRSGHLNPQDVFGALMLMCVFHSILEDTFLMWSLGGSLAWLWIARLILALSLTAGVTRLARRPFWRPLLVGRPLEAAPEKANP